MSSNEKVLSSQQLKLIEYKSDIAEKEYELNCLETELREIGKTIDKKRHRIKRRQDVLSSSSQLKSNQVVSLDRSKKYAFTISNCAAKKRKLNPSSNNTTHYTKIVRRKEKMEAVTAIHGASPDNMEPGLCGLLDTLTSKFKIDNLSEKTLNGKCSISNAVKRNGQSSIINLPKTY